MSKSSGNQYSNSLVKSLFYSEKPPYLILLFIGLIGFQANFIIEDASKSPILEYSDMKVTKLDSTNFLTEFKLTNLSTKLRFDTFRVLIMYPTEPDRYDETIEQQPIFSEAFIIPIAPTSIQTQAGEVWRKIKIIFDISTLQPETSTKLRFQTYFKNKNTNEISNPSIYLSSKSPIRLLESNTYTYLIKNKFELNIGLSVLWFFFLTLYIISYSLSKKYVK